MSNLHAQAAMPITDDEISAFMTAFSGFFSSCNLQALDGLFTADVQITFIDGNDTTTPTRAEYLISYGEMCRVGGGPTSGFKTLHSSYNISGPTVNLHYVIAKEYPLGLFKRHRINATLYQDFTVERQANWQLQIASIAETSEFHDLNDNGRVVSWNEAIPMGPLTRLQLLVEGWRHPADHHPSLQE